MNCRHAQRKITEWLAAGATRVPSKVLAHQQSCAACRDYFQKEQALFASISSGLHAVANPPVPPSLIPGVRARIENMVPSRHFWPYVLWAAAVAVVIAFAMLLPSLRHAQPLRQTPVAERKQEAPSPGRTPQNRPAATHEPAKRSATPMRRAPTAPESFQAAAAEVVIDGSESRGLVQMARVASQEPDVAQRLAPQHGSSPLVIAPVAIPGLEIQALAEESR